MTDLDPRAAIASRLPDPHALLRDTDWAALEHAYPGEWDARPLLAALLDPDPVVQAQALDDLEPVRHQNTIYAATVPVALYVAGILGDPRTGQVASARMHRGAELRSRVLRAVLLDWLADLAYDADDACVEIQRRHGWEPHPPLEEVRALRPMLFSAVAPFLGDVDPEVRHAALVAAIPLVEAPELAHHRNGLMPLAHGLLDSSQNRWHRSRAVDGCSSWGCVLHHGQAVSERTPEALPESSASSLDEPPF